MPDSGVMGEGTILDAVESDDLQAVAGVLGTVRDKADVTEEDRLRVLVAREYAKDEAYPGIATYAEDVLTDRQYRIDDAERRKKIKHGFETGKAGLAGVGIGSIGWAISLGEYFRESGDIRTYIGLNLATGGVFAYKRHKGMKNQDVEETTAISLADVDRFDNTVQHLQEHLYREYSIDTYGRNEIEVPLEYQ